MKRNIFSRALALTLVLVMSLGLFSGCREMLNQWESSLLGTVPTSPSSPTNPTDPTNPTLPADDVAVRFVVTSDTHFRVSSSNDMHSEEILNRFFTSTYKYIDSLPGKQLNAMFVVGDFVHGGSDTSYDFAKELSAAFKIAKAHAREGVDFVTMMGNHEHLRYGNVGNAAAPDTLNIWKEISGNTSLHYHKVINGYHFIAIDQDIANNGTQSPGKYTPEALDFLKNALAQAAKDDPTGQKPIFVFQHFPGAGTLYGATSSGGCQEIYDILKDYPQVVDFSGHTHRALLDPRSIWQGDYTAINTGTLEMAGAPINSHPSRSSVKLADFDGTWSVTNQRTALRSSNTIYMVEVSKDNEISLICYNIWTEQVDKVIELGKVGNKDEFKFDYESRQEAAQAPTWAEGTSLTLLETYQNYVRIAIPQATISADDLVTTYRCEVYKGDALVNTIYRLSTTYLGSFAKSSITAPLDALEAGTTYTVKVIPVSAWSKEGEPLTLTFTTAAATALPAPDILNAQFGADNAATNAITGEAMGVDRNATTVYNDALGKYVATNAGASAYKFFLKEYLALMQDGFSFEIYFSMDKISSSYSYVAACLADGGFGLRVDNGGKLTFSVYDGAKERKAVSSAAISTNEWVHVVGVYDDANDLTTIYVNGVATGTVASPGGDNTNFRFPSYDASFLCLGGNSSINIGNGYVSRLMSGKIADCNLYSEALTAAQVAALYANITK